MLRYASKIPVYGLHGRYLYAAHADQARQLLADGHARRRCTGGKVRVLEIIAPLISEQESRENASYHAGSSIRTTRIEEIRRGDEIVGHLIQHKRPGPADLYSIAVREAMSASA